MHELFKDLGIPETLYNAKKTAYIENRAAAVVAPVAGPELTAAKAIAVADLYWVDGSSNGLSLCGGLIGLAHKVGLTVAQVKIVIAALEEDKAEHDAEQAVDNGGI